jgi:hypothetical protein
VRSLGAWIIPLGGIAGLIVGILVAGILNSDCNTAAEAYWGCTHYNPGRLGLVGAGGGALLGVFVWGPWHDESRSADEDPPGRV